MIITIELPDTPAMRERILFLSDAERSRTIADLVMRYLPALRHEESEIPLTQDDLQAIGDGLQAMDAGRERDGAEVFADMEKRFGWTK